MKNTYDPKTDPLLRSIEEAGERGDFRELRRLQSEYSNQIAARAAKEGDKLLIHLLAAAEESLKENPTGPNAINGLLISLAGFRRAGLLEQASIALAPVVSRMMILLREAIRDQQMKNR